MAFTDPASIEFDLGHVPSLWRKMFFRFHAAMEGKCEVRILIQDTQSKRINTMSVTLGEDGIRNLRDKCDKALGYFEQAKKGSGNIPGREIV